MARPENHVTLHLLFKIIMFGCDIMKAARAIWNNYIYDPNNTPSCGEKFLHPREMRVDKERCVTMMQGAQALLSHTPKGILVVASHFFNAIVISICFSNRNEDLIKKRSPYFTKP